MTQIERIDLSGPPTWSIEELAILRSIEIEHRRWADRNFGTGTEETRKWLPFAAFTGVVEEIGEFFNADAGTAEECDALADVMIYLIDTCGRLGFQLADVLGSAESDPVTWNFDVFTAKGVNVILGKIAHAMLKSAQGIRNSEDHKAELYRGLKMLVLWLEDQADQAGRDLIEDLLVQTWDKVKRRNWVEDPDGANHEIDGAK